MTNNDKAMREQLSESRQRRKQKIIYESDDRFIIQLGIGHYQVFENGVTHATCIATIHYSGDEDKALMIAKKYANKEI